MSSFRSLNYSLSRVLDTSSNWTSRSRWRGQSWPCQVQGATRPDACNHRPRKQVLQQTVDAGNMIEAHKHAGEFKEW
jgi:hypothetical protein